MSSEPSIFNYYWKLEKKPSFDEKISTYHWKLEKSQTKILFLQSTILSAYLTTVECTPTVVIGNTTFIGSQRTEDIDFFGGIPFAEPPTGNLRLMPPVPRLFNTADRSDTSSKLLNATNFGPSCIQTLLPVDEISEDCLTVNIFRPSSTVFKHSTTLLPVMIWFYGGGYIIGRSSRYDGTPLVTRSITRGAPTIVVSANSRMGPLGFPRGEDVTRKFEEGSPILNLGLEDNVAAIEWVKQHIEAFGGDPDKITVFGESAGAVSLEILILNDRIRGLAKGVIMESTGGIPFVSPSNPQANDVWNNFIAAVPSCRNKPENTVDCLRTVTTPDIIQAYNTAGLLFNTSGADWFPVIGGDLLPNFPSTFRPQRGVVDAILIGSNLDEGTLTAPQTINSSQPIKELILSSPLSPPNASPAEREVQLEKLEAVVKQVLDLYPNDPSLGAPFGTGNDTFGLDPEYKRYASVATDFTHLAHRRYLVNEQLLKARIPTFTYLFADPDAVPVPDFVNGIPAPGSLGVTHSSEIFYVFGDLEVMTPTARKLSSTMMDYWISFANSLSPNDLAGNTRPFWPEYSSSNPLLLRLDGRGTTTIRDDFHEKQTAIFNKDPAIFTH
ncbi:alpha/beta-hydrolase [Dendrothele bispora CBS 962.96]|uniref:Carboxylic ester hydrolase n=1 Tax=Dendrothele bispora (strain CBS 962.96) TaxID=1314807 RepID=A0A4S8L7C1_DENBC|nr:alpha/beta-hydrolase [Dendrothele bispora CBS 962.96]